MPVPITTASASTMKENPMSKRVPILKFFKLPPDNILLSP
jgi:hypothetical protein